MIELITLGQLIDTALVVAVVWVFGKPFLVYCWKWWRKMVKEQRERLENERSKQ